MWVMTSIGFFSIVQKPEDRASGELTVRARVRTDLEALRAHLPSLGPIRDHAGTDYPFRARAPRAAVAEALSRLVAAIDYANFKDEVAGRQGHHRADVYGDVWSVLTDLERRPSPARSGSHS